MLSRIKSKLVSWLLKGVHIDRLEVGEHTVTIDSNNIALPGTVDGVDVSAHAANADAHHARSHDHSLAADGTPIAVAGVPNLDAAKITSGRFGKTRLEWTANKLLKGAGAGADPTEIDVPAGRQIATGSYAGNGAAARQIAVGFQCSLVIIMGNPATDSMHGWFLMPGKSSQHYAISPYHQSRIATVYIHATDGFMVDVAQYDPNQNGQTYYYFALSV